MNIETLMRYVLTGGLATAAHYAVMAFMLHVAGLSPVLSSTLGFVVGAATRFLTAHHYVFESRRRRRDTLPRFAIVLAAQATANGVLLEALLRLLGMVWVAQILATGLLIGASFLMHRHWTFR